MKRPRLPSMSAWLDEQIERSKTLCQKCNGSGCGFVEREPMPFGAVRSRSHPCEACGGTGLHTYAIGIVLEQE